MMMMMNYNTVEMAVHMKLDLKAALATKVVERQKYKIHYNL